MEHFENLVKGIRTLSFRKLVWVLIYCFELYRDKRFVAETVRRKWPDWPKPSEMEFAGFLDALPLSYYAEALRCSRRVAHDYKRTLVVIASMFTPL